MYIYNYKRCIYHVPRWRSRLECGFVTVCKSKTGVQISCQAKILKVFCDMSDQH